MASSYSVAEEPRTEDADTAAIAARMFGNQAIIDILSDLVAILETIKYEGRPTGARVFNTDWTRKLFQNCLPPHMQKKFNIEDWYTAISASSPVPTNKEFIGIIDPSLYNGTINTDWVTPLFHLEHKCTGFITMFHGILSLETKSRLKMLRHSKLSCQASSYGIYDDVKTGTAEQQPQPQPQNMDPVQKRYFIGWQ